MTNAYYPTQCKCGHIFLEKYQFNEVTEQGYIGFCWCGFCRTKRMVKPVYPVIGHSDLGLINTGQCFYYRWPTKITTYYLVFIGDKGMYASETSFEYQESQRQFWVKYREDMRETRTARRLEKSKKRRGLKTLTT